MLISTRAEAPSFKTPTINIGDRQKGRVLAKSVINSKGSIKSIQKAIKKGISKKFIISLKNNINPYGKGGASNKVFKIINSLKLDKNIVKKNFFDLR